MSVSRNSAKAVSRQGTTAYTVQSSVHGGRRARKVCPWHDKAANSRLLLQPPETRGHPVSNGELSALAKLTCQ